MAQLHERCDDDDDGDDDDSFVDSDSRLVRCDDVWWLERFMRLCVFRIRQWNQKFRLLGLEDEGTVVLRNARNFSLNNTASHPRRPESTATLL